MKINLRVNDSPVVVEVAEDTSLLHVLREQLQITSVKNGCDIGSCGVCTVVVNDKAIRSCTMPMKKLEGANILTIEGLTSNGELHPLQHAFIRHGALQCGFCTPAMILTAYALLQTNPSPSRDEIRVALNPVLCRCTGYIQILDAIQSVISDQ